MQVQMVHHDTGNTVIANTDIKTGWGSVEGFIDDGYRPVTEMGAKELLWAVLRRLDEVDSKLENLESKAESIETTLNRVFQKPENDRY